MTDSTARPVTGISLPSFLQLLEMERSSSSLTVAARGRSGTFFFKEGKLIDAGYEDKAGLEAACALLALPAPTLLLGPAQDRMERITQPLARILLHADEPHNVLSTAVFAAAGQSDPLLRRLLAEIIAMPAVRHYYLLDKKGKAVARSSDNQQLCSLIAYFVMIGLHLRKDLEVKGPYSIQAVLDSSDVLLMLPGAGMIIGLLLDENAVIADLIARIRAVLRSPAEREE